TPTPPAARPPQAQPPLRALREEDESIVLEVKGRDELAEVASAFNELSQSVHERAELARYVPIHARQYVKDMVAGRVRRHDEQQRITAVIMFTDVRGFTKLSEALAPEDVIAVANTVLDEQSAIIGRHGGRVDKFLGDGILAVFDGSRQAERALAAASEIQLRSSTLKVPALGGATLSIGVGMTLGEVIVGTIGNDTFQERAVLGAQVNLASRLCAYSKDNEVVVSGALFEQVRGRLPDAKGRLVTLKGIDQINVYSVASGSVVGAFEPRAQVQSSSSESGASGTYGNSNVVEMRLG
ncbi:MAG: adenylate/guanylate cyclase domain-containing protein, partial [Myxococcota bacterium]